MGPEAARHKAHSEAKLIFPRGRRIFLAFEAGPAERGVMENLEKLQEPSIAGPPERPAKRRRSLTARLGHSALLLAFLGLAVHILLPQIAALHDSLDVVRGLRGWALLMAVAAQGLSYLGSGYLLHSIAKVVGSRLPVRRGTLINIGAQSVGILGSGNLGYGAAIFRWMRQEGVRPEGAMLAGWLPFALITSMQTLFALFGVVLLIITHRLSRAMAVAFFLVLAILVGVLGGMFLSARDRTRFTERFMSLGSRWSRLARRSYDRAHGRRRALRMFVAIHRLRLGGWRGPVLGALLYVGFDLLTLASLFIATGYPVRPAIVLAGYGLPLVLGKLTVLPGGVGIVEGAMAALYEGMAVPAGVTVVAILAYRLISFWLPMITGFPLILYFQRHRRHQTGDAY
jgi:uncharacterized membrane protein YbhN (UPF0104 family)